MVQRTKSHSLKSGLRTVHLIAKWGFAQEVGAIPLLVRRGGRDIKKNAAKPPSRSGRGGDSQTPTWTCEPPPRLRRCRSLPSSRGGDSYLHRHYLCKATQRPSTGST